MAAEWRLKRGAPTGLRAALAGLAALGVLSACETAPPSAPSVGEPQRPVIGAPPEPVTRPVPIPPPAYTPAHMSGLDDIVRVGLLLPFSASSPAARAEAAQILRAAELSLFTRGDERVLLLPRDTAGTRAGAADAAAGLAEDGVDLIFGPLLSGAVAGASGPARRANIPVIAFSTDPDRAGDGVYLLSFPPSEEVRRITEYARQRGAERFAFVGPDSAYGRAVAAAYQDNVERLTEGLEPRIVEIEAPEPEDAPEPVAADPFAPIEPVEPERIEVEVIPGLREPVFYTGSVASMTQAARTLAALGVRPADPEDARALSLRSWEPSLGDPFQVLMLPEGGDQLRTLAPVMIFADIDPLIVKFVGTSLWRDADVAREPALAGGWFAGPDPETRAPFERAFEAAYGAPPSRLAGLGYDAVSLAAAVAAAPGEPPRSVIENPDGFSGVDGLFRFREDGTLERGLAVYTIRRSGFATLEPAPTRFEEPDDASALSELIRDHGGDEAEPSDRES
ncbi:MAG: penicillin-binding protein activator [Pseudomonadota bacterium]